MCVTCHSYSYVTHISVLIITIKITNSNLELSRFPRSRKHFYVQKRTFLKRRLPLGSKSGFGFVGFLSDFGVLLKNDKILFCFLDLGVELIIFNFISISLKILSQVTESKNNAPKRRRGSSILNLERTISLRDNFFLREIILKQDF